jgi:hypothetical protein
VFIALCNVSRAQLLAIFFVVVKVKTKLTQDSEVHFAFTSSLRVETKNSPPLLLQSVCVWKHNVMRRQGYEIDEAASTSASL